MSLTEYEKKVRTHALLMGIAFLVIIPMGVLIARYLRTFTNRSVLWHAKEIQTKLDLCLAVVDGGGHTGSSTLLSPVHSSLPRGARRLVPLISPKCLWMITR